MGLNQSSQINDNQTSYPQNNSSQPNNLSSTPKSSMTESKSPTPTMFLEKDKTECRDRW